MARHTEVVDFLRSDPALLLGVLRELARTRDGWVNLQAVEDDDEAPGGPTPRAGVFGLVSGRGPRVPVATWVPGDQGGRHPEPDSLGIQHGAGPKAMRQLVASGLEPPEGATLLSDHPRRGLVVGVAAGTDPAALVEWLFAACDRLAPEPLPDTWTATVHHR